ncbi:MAG: D-lyxose/D-mannose family sugar isomerase [Firmicutes bacterium HGW-Firmicutes-7]|nr:MAG: D-lyxose/D-mannose family sugar isomerase [Firmicutes bacterium HGW-Firmicutes-7]
MQGKELLLVKQNIINIFKSSGMVFTQKEIEAMEITDFGLNDFYNIGLGIIIYVNTERICAKELAMTPFQICPSHMHPNINSTEGKEETFRCRVGEVYLYVEGFSTENIKARIPDKYLEKFNVFHEIILKPGDQYTLKSQTWHWFQAGEEGAVLSEFSTHSFDAMDIFFDKNIKRIPKDN